MRIREYVYDGFGRLIQTTSPMDGGGDYVERFVYDGTRRVQQFANANNAGEQLKREYIWSPVGGVDELLVEYEGDRDVGDVQGFYAIHDIAGDLVALCDLNGGATHKARVVGQWTYDAYGGVLTAEQIQANMPLRHIGHKGLFIDRLDAPAADSSGDELLRLIPYGHNVYHNRNRVYAPAMGRFLQRDPNQSALAVLGGSHSGRGTSLASLTFSFEGMYGDGMNLYAYMGANPSLRRDPMGLSYDPFDMVDDYLAETAGNRAALLGAIGQGGKSAAIVGAQILSMTPFPLASIVGDVALYALGEQSAAETMGAIALGIIPGGKLLKPLGGAAKGLGKTVAGIGASAWTSTKHYAAQGASFLRSSVGGHIDEAFSLVKRKGLRGAARTATGKACGCFIGSTLVWTPAGAVPIAELAEGQEVLVAPEEGAASDHASALIGTKIDVYEASLVHLVLVHETGDVEVLHTTDEYPFHRVEMGGETETWTRADRLRVGDGLSTISGVAELVGISFGRETVPVYNLSIPGTPTYYVGEYGVWVHNCWAGNHHLIPKYLGGAKSSGGIDLTHAKHVEMHRFIDAASKSKGIPTRSNGAAAVDKWLRADPVQRVPMLRQALVDAYERFDIVNGTNYTQMLLDEINQQAWKAQ